MIAARHDARGKANPESKETVPDCIVATGVPAMINAVGA